MATSSGRTGLEIEAAEAVDLDRRAVGECAARLAIIPPENHLVAVEEGVELPASIIPAEHHAAADGEGTGWRVDRNPAFILGDLAADEAHHPFAEGRDDLSAVRVRVVNELVDDEIGAGADGEGRAIDEQHLD